MATSKPKPVPVHFNFVQRDVDRLPIPASGRVTFWDTKVPKLALRVAASGTKTFCLVKRRHGKVIWLTLGRWPDLSIPSAREQAMRALLAFDDPKRDPQEVKRAAKAAPTLDEIYTRWIAGRKGLSSVNDDIYRYAKWIAPKLAKRKVNEITLADIEDVLHNARTAGLAGSTLNSIRAIVSGLLKYAVQHQHIERSPLQPGLIKREKVPKRKRVLTEAEIPAFFAALDAEGGDWADFFKLAIFTGARRANLCAMKWRDIDMAAAVWIISADESKNGQELRTVLAADAIEILQRRKGVHDRWVFPSTDSKTGHVVQHAKPWQRILKGAGLTAGRKDGGLTLHDLRRTLGTLQANQGVSLAIIGKSLGHESVEATTHYAHIDDTPVRESVTRATKAIKATVDRAKRKKAGSPDGAPSIDYDDLMKRVAAKRRSR